jgi:hypothetical protein
MTDEESPNQRILTTDGQGWARILQKVTESTEGQEDIPNIAPRRVQGSRWFNSRLAAAHGTRLSIWLMRLFLCLLVAVIAAGCHSAKPDKAPAEESGWPRMEGTDLARPGVPEVQGWMPQTAPSAAEEGRLEREASAAYSTVFERKLPKKFALEAAPIGWLNAKGELKQLRAAASLPRQVFQSAFPLAKWAEVPVPAEYLVVMHLSPGTPTNEMTCYVGRVRGKPAYVFWSEAGETVLLVIDY